jgi:hypothetical protein
MKARILQHSGVRLLLLLNALLFCWCSSLSAGNPYAAYYSTDTDKILWFIHASDPHIGTSGTTDSSNLQWLVGQARQVIGPSFIVVSGDLTYSTNGNLFGYPNGPYQAEWDQYKNILSANGVDASFYFDLPGNHDAYNDKYFSYYLANSVQGRATHRTQASWTRSLPMNTYHFLGVNTADNTGKPFSLVWPYGDYAGLDSSELDFISSELNANAGAALTLVFGHHPLVPTGDSTDTYLFYGKDEFVSLMNNHGASLYGYGHTHASSEQFFSQNMTSGIFYFNVSSLGKDSPNQYTVTAIDCNGIASVTQNVNTWPVVLITAPMNRRLGGTVNPYAYTVTNSASNPIRALVFDPTSVSQVQFRVNGGAWQPMTVVSGNPRLWQGNWNSSSLSEGEYTLEVQAATGSGVRSDTITTYVKSQVQPRIGISGDLKIGKYITSGSGKTKTTVFSPSTLFKQGDTVVIRGTVKDASGNPVANATVGLTVSGPSSVTLTSAPSDGSGVAEAKWTTTAPNRRGQGGTPTGGYTATVTGLSASGYLWDGVEKFVTFTITQ